MMKIVFIGAGNVATHLATELYKYDFDIAQVYSRTDESAQSLANLVEAEAITDIKNIIDEADLYIFSVKDSILEELASRLSSNNGIWIHTAGSIPLNIFEKYVSKYGVLYPFQTFSKNRKIEWGKVPIFIEASDSKVLQSLEKTAHILSDKVTTISSDQRKYLHLTGVFACNFVNHMYTLSSDILKKAGLPFDVALPLIDETAAKVHSIMPKDAQTGPAIRYDENVINTHLSLIEDEKVKEIYRLISENIHKTSLNP